MADQTLSGQYASAALTQSLKPNHSLPDHENLIGLVGMLAAFTSDRRTMERAEIDRWARMYRGFLMVARGGTLADVFAAANEWIGASSYFPTVANLAPLVERRVAARREAEAVARAQREAEPLYELRAGGERDQAHTPTRDLPPGYDYSQDPHWHAGLDLLLGRAEQRGPLAAGLGQLLRDLDRRRRAFQGASKPRELVCPACQGARYVALGGWDGHPNDIGQPGSRYVRCPVCCPGGRYSAAAERDAVRRRCVRGEEAE